MLNRFNGLLADGKTVETVQGETDVHPAASLK
jgi:hypothetical protein